MSKLSMTPAGPGAGPVVAELPIVSDMIGSAVESASNAAVEAVSDLIFGLISGAVSAITGALVDAMLSTSDVSLEGDFGGLGQIRATVLGLSLVLMLAMLLLNVIQALVAGEPGPVIRAALVDLPAAVMLTTVFVTFASILLQVTDAVSNELISDVPAAIGSVSAALVAGSVAPDGMAVSAGVAGGGLLGIIFSLMYIFGALMVWAQLLIRSALIYIIVIAAPLGYATRANPATRQLARRTSEILIAVIISKLGIALTFGVGASMITSAGGPAAGTATDLGTMFTGVVVVALSAFMPWMLLKAIPVMEAATVAAGAERSPMRAAATGAGVALTAVNLAGGMAARGGRSAAGTNGAASLASPPSGTPLGAPASGSSLGGSSSGGSA